MSLIGISIVLTVLMVVLLAGGVWIGIALLATGWAGMQFAPGGIPAGSVLATKIWGNSASWELAALPLFIWMGEILYRTRLSEEMFRGLVAVAQLDPRAAAARQRARLRHLRLGVGLVGGDLRDGRQDRAARTEEARLRRHGEPRLARRRRHARHPDPALDHHGGLCGAGERLDHPGVPRGLPARPARDGAVFRLHRVLVARPSGPLAAGRSADAVRSEAARVREARPADAAHRVRVPVAADGLGDRDRMRRLGRARLARDRVVARHRSAGRRSGRA